MDILKQIQVKPSPASSGDQNAGPPLREVSVARGNLYLSRETCETYLPGVIAIALLARDENILIVPLTQQSGGGLLLKQRNARGDRIIHAQEFFREKGYLEEFDTRTVPVQWSQESAALVVTGISKKK